VIAWCTRWVNGTIRIPGTYADPTTAYQHVHEPDTPEKRPVSIAILPFEDTSDGADQAHLGEGIAAELIGSLSSVQGLRVASRTSAFASRSRFPDAREFARSLGAEFLLHGSVYEAEGPVHLDARLVRVADGSELWSGSYERGQGDIFEIRASLAHGVVEALGLEPDERGRRALGRIDTRDPAAYDLCLRARRHFFQSHRKGIQAASELFLKAIAQDPNYARAYAGMAECSAYRHMYFGGDAADLDGARWASQQALKLDPELAEAHAARGLVATLEEHFADADQAFETALHLNPNLYEAHYFRARTFFAQGNLEAAARWFRSAAEVDPAEYQAHGLLGFVSASLGRTEEAETARRQALCNVERRLEQHPEDTRALYLGADALLGLGDAARASEWAERVLAIAPDDPYVRYGLACLYSKMSEPSKALDHLEASLRAGFAHREWIDNDSDLDSIRNETRYRLLVDTLI